MKEVKLKNFETVIKAFDMTIQHAIVSREPILFDCVEIPTVITKERLKKKKEFIDSMKIKGVQ